MSLSAFFASLLRRWYLVLLALGCSVAATYLVVDMVGPKYHAEATALVFPPTNTVREGANLATEGNPYLFLGGLSQARDLVIRKLSARSVVERFEREEPGVTFVVRQDVISSGPVIVIDVTAPTPRAAMDTMDKLAALVPQALDELQADLDLPPTGYITSIPLTRDDKPEVLHKTQIRVGIVAAGATAAIGLLVVGLFDGLRSRRRSSQRSTGRRAQRDEPAAEERSRATRLRGGPGATAADDELASASR